MREIVVASHQMNRNPHLAGANDSVFQVVYGIHNSGEGRREMLARYPKEDIRRAISNCAERRCRKDNGYCGGCSLRRSFDEFHTKEDLLKYYSRIIFAESGEFLEGTGKNGILGLPGSLAEFSETWRGLDGWRLARELLKEDAFSEDTRD